MVLQKNSNQTLWYLLIACTFFAFLMPLSSTLFVSLCVLALLAVVFLNDNDILCFLAFVVCFAGGTRLTALFLSIFDAVLAMLIVKHLILAIKNKDRKKVVFISATLSITFVLTLYGLTLTKFHFYKLGQSLGLIFAIVAIYLFEKIDLKKIILILSLGLISSTILSLISYVCGISVDLPFIVDSSSKFRFGAYFSNINALAMYCSLCQTSILALMLLKKLDVKKYVALLIAVTIIGLSTFSKTFILLTLATYTLAGLIGFVKSRNKKKYVLFSLMIVAILAVLAIIFKGYIIAIVKRFFDNNAYSGGVLNVATTGRMEIWKWYMDKWTSSPLYMLFGCGITADNINERTPHSIYISILYKFGIIGAILLVGCLVWVLKNKSISRDVAAYLPIVLIMANGLSEDITCSLYTSLPILIALLFILYSKNCKSKGDK